VTVPERATALSARQLEVLGLIAQGKKDAEIGTLLHIKPSTVSTTCANIKRKLRAKNRAHMVTLAVGRGLITLR